MDLGIGDALRDARRSSGSSLADAAADTRVRESYLAALEQEEFSSLGSDVYVRGFITSYARFLRLDPAPLLAAYRSGVEAKPEPRDPVRSDRVARANRSANRSLSAPSRRRRRRSRATPVPLPVVAVGAVLLLLILILILSLRGGGDDAASGAALALVLVPA